MRLICPNCDAEYEVDDAAIPDGGRDVQCSNCGHGWFQLPAEVETAIAEEEALFGVPAVSATEVSPDPAPPVRRKLDEDLMAVLREEAEREAAARRAEAAPIETQTEMPLAAPPQAATPSQAARRIARLKGVDPDAPAPQPARPNSRRQLLPDIEEINSSLRSSTSETDQGPDRPPAPRRGFKSGFLLALFVAAIGAGIYAAAPRITAEAPALGPALAAYTARVDQGRLWLDDAMRRATETIKGMTAANEG